MIQTRIRSLCLLLVLSLPQLAHADWPPFLVPPTTHQSVLVNPFFWAGNGGVTYERSINDDLSWNAGIDGGLWGVPGNYYRVMGINGGATWWIKGDFWPHPQRPLVGWFAGPQIHVRSINWHYEVGPTGYDAYGTYFGAGGQGGYQWIFAPGLTARAFVEAGYLVGTVDSRSGAPSLGFGGGFISPAVAVGWSF